MTDASRILPEFWQLAQQELPSTLALRPSITWKPDGSPVTEAYHRHEQVIGDFLCARLPGVQLVAEESFFAHPGKLTDAAIALDRKFPVRLRVPPS